MNIKDTIIAPATAPGEGGVAIVRISGPGAYSALKNHFRSTSNYAAFKSHHFYHGVLVDYLDQPVDEVLVVYMAAPNSYTRDDVVEIHSHGSRQVVKLILSIYQKDGLRLAEPGEFTYRAYMNGRLDLAQAEAVARLISSRTDASRKLALSQVEGALSKKIYSFAQTIKTALVFVEAWIDFPEEDLPDENVSSLSDQIKQIYNCMLEILSSYDYGRVLSDGASIMLVGRPNVGKSSLLNKLLGEERAIVTDIPGTTRDLLEEGVVIDGIPVRLIDTAGLRQTEDPVESEGVLRAINKMSTADLVLMLVDSSSVLTEQDFFVYEQCRALPTLLVLTKSDLISQQKGSPFNSFSSYCEISTKSGQGIDNLKSEISRRLSGEIVLSAESIMLTERRHYEALQLSSTSLRRFVELLNIGESLDMLALELRDALYHLGQISGETTTESLLDDIFSNFCIGK